MATGEAYASVRLSKLFSQRAARLSLANEQLLSQAMARLSVV
jgi:hypothetical protein